LKVLGEHDKWQEEKQLFPAGWWIDSLSGAWLGGSESVVGVPAGKSQDCSAGFTEMTLLCTAFMLSAIFFSPFFT